MRAALAGEARSSPGCGSPTSCAGSRRREREGAVGRRLADYSGEERASPAAAPTRPEPTDPTTQEVSHVRSRPGRARGEPARRPARDRLGALDRRLPPASPGRADRRDPGPAAPREPPETTTGDARAEATDAVPEPLSPRRRRREGRRRRAAAEAEAPPAACGDGPSRDPRGGQQLDAPREEARDARGGARGRAARAGGRRGGRSSCFPAARGSSASIRRSPPTTTSTYPRHRSGAASSSPATASAAHAARRDAPSGSRRWSGWTRSTVGPPPSWPTACDSTTSRGVPGAAARARADTDASRRRARGADRPWLSCHDRRPAPAPARRSCCAGWPPLWPGRRASSCGWR